MRITVGNIDLSLSRKFLRSPAEEGAGSSYLSSRNRCPHVEFERPTIQQGEFQFVIPRTAGGAIFPKMAQPIAKQRSETEFEP
jgi:hypothetical protein